MSQFVNSISDPLLLSNFKYVDDSSLISLITNGEEQDCREEPQLQTSAQTHILTTSSMKPSGVRCNEISLRSHIDHTDESGRNRHSCRRHWCGGIKPYWPECKTVFFWKLSLRSGGRLILDQLHVHISCCALSVASECFQPV